MTEKTLADRTSEQHHKPKMTSYENSVYLAKLAEQAERYELSLIHI